jgi:hypothetical protein
MQLSEYEIKALNKLGESIQDGKWSNSGLVQLIELCGSYLNLMSIQEYANLKSKSYNGIKKTKKVTKILKHKFIIENE